MRLTLGRSLACLAVLTLVGGSFSDSASAARRTRLLLTVDASATSATEGSESGDGPAVLVGSSWDNLRRLLGEWKQEVEAGNLSQAEAIPGRMKRLLGAPGIKSRSRLLSGFVAVGNVWLLDENFESAELAYKAALELEQSFTSAHVGKAQLAWARQRADDGMLFNPVGIVSGTIVAAKARLSSRLGRVQALANVSLVLLMATIMSALGFSLVLVVKYGRLLRHGVEEKVADHVPEGIDRLLGWLAVFLPIICFMPMPYWALYWLVVLGSYGGTRERLLSVAALAGLALVPGAFHATALTASLPQDPVFRAVAALEEQSVTPGLIRDLEGFVNGIKGKKDVVTGKFLLARTYTEAGRVGEALEVYDDIVTSDRRNARAHVNRGNIHFNRDDHGRAIADYVSATEKDRKELLAWRNGAVAYTANIETERGEEWLKSANKIDRERVKELRSELGGDRVADASLTSKERSRLESLSRDPLRGSMVSSALTNSLTLAALPCLLLMLYRLAKPGGPLAASACEKCGRAFCVKCNAAAKESAYCTQCVHLYVKKDGVSPEVRTAKQREVKRHQDIHSLAIRLFNLILPGAGGLYASHALLGGVLLFTWSAAISSMLLPTYMVMEPTRLGHIDLVVSFAVELAILVGVYIVALIQSLRH